MCIWWWVGRGAHGIGEVGEAGCTLHFSCVEGAGVRGEQAPKLLAGSARTL